MISSISLGVSFLDLLHVDSKDESIENFKLLHQLYYDSTKKVYMLVGLVGDSKDESYKDLNKI